MGLDENGDRARVTNIKKPELALSTLEKKVGALFIRAYLLPDYRPARSGGVRRAVLTSVKEQVPAASENIELTDLPQRATGVDTVIKTLIADAAANTDGFSM